MNQPGSPRRPHPPARWLVLERDGSWAVRLRREAGLAGPVLVETRSLTQLWDSLADSPASFLVMELGLGGIAGQLERMARLPRDFPAARVAVVAAQDLAGHEPLLREAGAVLFVTSRRQVGPLVDVARRHLAQVEVPRLPPAEEIWARLPWSGSGNETSSMRDR